jgi:glycosyltransferase involved in cell wall biosynthesis
MLSVVSPVYNACELVPRLIDELNSVLPGICDEYEIVLIDDRSTDLSWISINEVCRVNPHVKGIRLSRNFGQHAAITAGLSYARGDWVVVMDCDLQDQPDQIPLLYAKAMEGYDLVCAKRIIRNDRKSRKILSRLFYKIFSYLTGTKQDASVANFGIYNQKVVNSILSMQDNIRYLPAMLQWVGFKSAKLEVNHGRREIGRSSYSLPRMIRLALDNIVSFSDKPLRLAAIFGILVSLSALSVGIYYLVGYLNGSISVAGYTSLIVSIWLTAGINIFVLGLVGIYVGKSFEKVKGRPIFIVDTILN